MAAAKQRAEARQVGGGTLKDAANRMLQK